MVKSGYFADSRQMAQAVVKITLGRTLGLDPVSSMMGLFVNNQGRLCMTANLMAATMRRSGRYDYEILEHSATMCKIQYYRRAPSGWKPCGPPEVTRIEDFKHLTSEPWKKYPKNMLFARNISNGAKFHTPDAFGGSSVYLPDEIPGSGLEVDGETLEVTRVNVKVEACTPAVSSPELATLLDELQAAGLPASWVHLALNLAEKIPLRDLTDEQVRRARHLLAERLKLKRPSLAASEDSRP